MQDTVNQAIQQTAMLLFIVSICATIVAVLFYFLEYCWHVSSKLEHWFYVRRPIRKVQSAIRNLKRFEL